MVWATMKVVTFENLYVRSTIQPDLLAAEEFFRPLR